MSADSHTVCLRCHPELVDREGITNRIAEQEGHDRDVRENIDYYVKDGNTLVFEYVADCWTCGWHYDTVLAEPIPGLEPT